MPRRLTLELMPAREGPLVALICEKSDVRLYCVLQFPQLLYSLPNVWTQ
jgi:hypothetical protein